MADSHEEFDSQATDTRLMNRCLELAREAEALGEVPVGALVVDNSGEIVSEAYNRREIDRSPIAHAELLAIEAASKKLGRWRLSGCTLYVTLEPCTMCAGAIVLSRVDRVVFGARDLKAGAVGSIANVVEDERLNHRAQVTAGVCADECGQILSAFFAARRAQKKT